MTRRKFVDFKSNEETIYFKKADVLGIKGLVCNLRGVKRNSLPLQHRLKFYFLEFTDDGNVKIYTSRPLNGHINTIMKLDMLVTIQNITQVDESEHGVLTVDESEVAIMNSYVYKSEFVNFFKYLRTHKYWSAERCIDSKNAGEKDEKKSRTVYHQASAIIDGVTRHFLFTNSFVKNVNNGYKYYVFQKHKFEYPTYLAINERHADPCIGTIISANPIMTDFFGICYLDWKSNFEVEKRAYPRNLVDSWSSRHSVERYKAIDVLRGINKVKKELKDKSDLEVLFAVTLRNTLNRGTVGFIGKEMKFVYIDNFGRCFDKDGIVSGEVAMMFLIDKYGNMQDKISKERLSNVKYEIAMDFAKNRFPNR